MEIAAQRRLPIEHLIEVNQDRELVARILDGDTDAFAELMRRHNRRLYRAARAILRDEAESEDVVQETYLRALAALPEFRWEASLATWLTRIAVNEAIGQA